MWDPWLTGRVSGLIGISGTIADTHNLNDVRTSASFGAMMLDYAPSETALSFLPGWHPQYLDFHVPGLHLLFLPLASACWSFTCHKHDHMLSCASALPILEGQNLPLA